MSDGGDDRLGLEELRHLAAAMAHEVRNPLNAMAIHIELLAQRLQRLLPREGEGDAAGVRRSLGVLEREVTRIDGILEAYLRVAGPDEAPRQAVPIDALLEEAAAAVRSVAARRGVSLALSVDAQGAGAWPVDREALTRALAAVLRNAVAASPRGGTVTVVARRSGDEGELVVQDRGPGVAPEDRTLAFKLGESRWGGPGAGLTVAKQIIKSHGGGIVLEPDPTGGTRATLRLSLSLDEGDLDGDL